MTATATRPVPAAERIRGAHACDRCCQMKVRCNGQTPCDHCKNISKACIYLAKKKRGPPKGCPARGGRKRLSETEPTLQQSVNSEKHDTTAPRDQPPSQAYTSPFQQSGGIHPLESFSSSSQHSVSWENPLRDRQTTPPSHSLHESTISSLLDIYLAFVHPHWPIIYLPLLRDLHELRGKEPLLFEVVLSVAAATYDQSIDQDSADSSNISFLSTKTSNQMVEYVRSQLLGNSIPRRIETIQALILISVVDLGYGRPSQAYQFGGIACRMAFDLGLHETNFERVPPHKKQEGLRVLWGCYILDKILSAVLQKPVMMRREDIDVAFPDTMERDEYDLWLSGPSRRFVSSRIYTGMEYAKVHCLSSFQAWANVMHILEQILGSVYSRRAMQERRGSSRQMYDAILARLDGELRLWKESLPAHLQWSNDHSGVGPHFLTLRAWYYACLLLLNRPRIPCFEVRRRGSNGAGEGGGGRGDKHTSSMNSGTEICKLAAEAICDIMETYEGTFRTRKIPSSWVYLIFQAATIHSSFSSTSQTHPIDYLSPERRESARRFDECIQWLSRISQTWTSASHHVDTLKSLEHVSALTRPATPVTNTMGIPRLLEYSLAAASSSSTSPTTVPDSNEAWQAFWNDMPASSEDANSWEHFGVLFAQ
ncbi:hypothetical protein CBS101457_006873 [Exobasidium rhododendri]|nr:hypothetical protein CBS101457_006873 [Exobasidium rhododendri]